MVLGVSFGGFPDTPIGRIAELLVAVGVCKVEIAVGALSEAGPAPKENLKLLRDQGVEVVCLSTQFPINAGGEAHGAQAALCGALRLAAEVGITRVNSYSGQSELEDGERAVSRYLERVGPCVREAERAGVTLLIENQIDVAPGNACRTVGGVLRVLRHFDSPSLRHTYDPANYYGAGEDALGRFAELRPFIGHAHLKDVTVATPGLVEAHPRYRHWPFPERPMMAVPAGEGEGPVDEAYRLLHESGYAGVVCTEPFVEEEPLRRAVEHLRGLGVGD